PTACRRRTGRIPGRRHSAKRRDDRLPRADHPVCRGWRDRRDGLRLLVLGDRSSARLDDREVEALIGLMPLLALAVKCVSLTRIAGTLVETYLGRDAGRRVLAGRIRRGIAEPIGAVLWYSDLRGFTRITDQAPPQQVIPLLNDYAEAVISAVHDSGGDVLKLIGDGTLAIFTSGSTG